MCNRSWQLKESENYCPVQLPVFVDKVLLEHNHTHSFGCFSLAELRSSNNDHMAWKPRIFTIWTFKKEKILLMEITSARWFYDAKYYLLFSSAAERRSSYKCLQFLKATPGIPLTGTEEKKAISRNPKQYGKNEAK